MPDIVLTEGELEVLSRCSGTAVKAYLRLRSRMDFTSGVVGARVGISYQALREWTEEAVEKGGGETLLQPSLQNIRTAVNQLVRRGLLRRAKTEKLVFKCLLARTGEVRQKQTQHEPNRAKSAEPNTEHNTNLTEGFANDGAAFDVFDTDEPNTEPNTNLTGQKAPNPTHIRYPIKASTSQAAYTAVNGVGVEQAVAALASAKRVDGEAAPDEALSRRAVALAVVVRQKGGSVTATDPRVRRWAEQGVTDAQMVEAMQRAKVRREEEGSAQAISAGFLDVLLRDVLNPPKPKSPPWWNSVASMEAKAREMGIAGARPGEEMDAFRARITAAIRRVEGAAA